MSYRHKIKLNKLINTQKRDKQIKEINIYSITGDRILTTTNLNINTTSLNKGIYLIKVTYNNGNFENDLIQLLKFPRAQIDNLLNACLLKTICKFNKKH